MLQHKDLSLTTSMISLGSSIMKFNSVASLAPYSWPEVDEHSPLRSRKQHHRLQGDVELSGGVLGVLHGF